MSRKVSHQDKSIEFSTVPEVAERLGVFTRTVWRWIESKLLIAYRINGVVPMANASGRHQALRVRALRSVFASNLLGA
jgi:excisionase family DNA binding protein